METVVGAEEADEKQRYLRVMNLARKEKDYES